MATKKAKRSVHPSKAARRYDRRASNRHPDRSKPAERRNSIRSSSAKATKPKHKKQKQAAPRNNRGASTRHPDPGSSSAERRTSNRSSAAHTTRSSSPSPGEFALRERTLPGRRFVEFPLVKGKVIERVQLFTTTNYNSLTIELQDHTSLVLGIEPGFTIHAQLMRLEKGELDTLTEWPPIKNITDR